MSRNIRTKQRRQRQIRQERDRRQKRQEEALVRNLARRRVKGEQAEDEAWALDEEQHRRVADQASEQKGYPAEQLLLGQVTETRGRHIRVRVPHSHEEYDCRLRSGTRITHKESSTIVVGDRVQFLPQPDYEGTIVEVLPRKTRLSRASRLHREVEQVIAANIDRVAVVFSIRNPYPKFEYVDRTLIAASHQNLPALICLNKVDLAAEKEEIQWIQGIYEHAGFPMLTVSAERGDGLDELARLTLGKVTLFTGQSGVGKSSLINALDPTLNLQTSRVIKAGKGRHTTTRTILLPFQQGGYLVDTPGLKLFDLWSLAAEEVREYFQEFAPYAPDCRFASCTHTHEPDCAVKAAVDTGDINIQRYSSYEHIVKTIREEQP